MTSEREKRQPVHDRLEVLETAAAIAGGGAAGGPMAATIGPLGFLGQAVAGSTAVGEVLRTQENAATGQEQNES